MTRTKEVYAGGKRYIATYDHNELVKMTPINTNNEEQQKKADSTAQGGVIHGKWSSSNAPNSDPRKFIPEDPIEYNERKLLDKTNSGTASARERAISRVMRKDRESKLSPNIADDYKKLIDEYNSFDKKVVTQNEFDKMRENSKKIRDNLQKYSEYFDIYGSDNETVKMFDEMTETANGINDEWSKFKTADEYRGVRVSSKINTYAELRQKRALLQRKRGNEGYNSDRIESELNALEKYGYNKNVVASMTEEDFKNEIERLKTAKENAGIRANKYNSYDYINAQYNDAVNVRGLSEEEAKKELQEQQKNAGREVEYYDGLLNEMTELERITKIERNVQKKWGDYKNAVSLGGVPVKKIGESGSKEYDVLNNSDDMYSDSPNGMLQRVADNSYVYSYATDEERNTYNYIHDTVSPEKASEFLEDITPLLNKRKSTIDSLNAYNFGKQHAIIGTAGSVLFNALPGALSSIVNNAENIISSVTGKEIDPYDPRFQGTKNAQMTQQGVKDNIDSNIWKIAYSAGTQAVEQALTMGIAAGIGGAVGKTAGAFSKGANTAQIANKSANIANQVLLSSKAMLSTTLEYKENGESDLAAVGMGMLSGIIEAYTESNSLSNLLKSPDIFKDMAKSAKFGKWAKKVGIDALKEGLEEVESNALNTVAALVFDYRNNDTFLSAIDNAKRNGKTDSEALAEAIKTVAPEYIESFAVGALAGGVFGAANTASSVRSVNSLTDFSADYFSKNGTSIENVTKLLIDMGYTDEAQIYKAANAIMKKGNGKNVSAENEALFEDDLRLRGVLHGYVEVVDAKMNRDRVNTVLSEVREASASADFENDNSEKAVSTMLGETVAGTSESDIEARGQGYTQITETDSGKAFRERGRNGSKIYTYALNEGGLAEQLVNEGYTAEQATKVIDNLFTFMYNQGRTNGDMELAVRTAAENILPNHESEAREFFVAGQMDAQGRLIGKTNAMLVPNQTLKNMQKNGQINSVTVRAINALASKLGINIRFSDMMRDGEAGYFNKATGTLMINANAKNKYFLTTVHESIHAIRTIHPESYNKLSDIVYEVLSGNESSFDKAWSKTLAIYKKEASKDGKLNRDLIDEELTAKVVSHLLTDESYIKELAKTNRNAVQRIYDAIVDLFEKIFKRYSEDATPSEVEFKDALKELQSDFNSVKAMYENALKETTNVQQSKLVLPKSADGTDGFNSKTITADDVRLIQSIGRKSLNELTEEELKKLENVAQKYYAEMGVKSPFFRRWFGDWRAEDKTKITFVDKLGDVSGEYTNKDTQWKINNSSKIHNEKHDSVASIIGRDYLPYLNDIIKYSVLLNSEVSNKTNNSIMYHSLYAVVKNSNNANIGNLVKLVVEELWNPNGDTLKRSYKIVGFKEISAGVQKVHSKELAFSLPTDDMSVSDLFSLVKTYDKDFKPKPCSLVLNKDGTPKVLYHGTESFGFTKFVISKSDDKLTIFFTDSPEIASTYSGKEGISSLKKQEDVDIDKMSPAEVVEALNKYSDADDEYLNITYRYMSLLSQKDLKHDVEFGLNLLLKDLGSIQIEDKEGLQRARENLIDAINKKDYSRISTPLYTLLHYSDIFRNHQYVQAYAELESNIRLLNKLSSMSNSPKIIGSDLGGYRHEVYEIDEAKEHLKFKSGKGIYAAYVNMRNPLIIDGKGQNWNNIRNWSDSLIPPENELKIVNDNGYYRMVVKNTGMQIPGATVPETGMTNSLSESDLISFLRQEALNIWAIRTESAKNTRSIAKIANQFGYDGVIFNNIFDSGGKNSKYNNLEATIYVVFNPNNIKSVENGGMFSSWDDDMLLSKDYWQPDLSRPKLNILYQRIDKDADSSVKYVTNTAKWMYTNIDGTKVFAIYSIEDISSPTLLYESKGKQAAFERDILIDLLEENGNGTSVNGKSSFTERISKGDWLPDVSGMANNQRGLGGTRGNTDVGVLPRQSKRKPSGAFISVIKNLFGIEEKTRGNELTNKEDVLKSKESTGGEVVENIDRGIRRTAEQVEASYFELKKEVQKKLDEHIKKYGAIKKGEDAVRDAQFPAQTSDDRYVRRFTRTAFEADSVTDEVASQVAEEVANGSLWTTYTRVTDKRSVEIALNRFKSIGYEKMLEEWEGKIASNERIEKGDIAKAMVLVQEASKRGDMKTAMGLIAEIAAEGTRAGQLVQSLSLLKKLSGQANVYYIEKTIQKIQQDIDKKYSGKFSKKKHVVIKVPDDLLKKFKEVYDREKKSGSRDHSGSDKIIDDIMKNVAEQMPVTWGDKLNAVRYFQMLGNPRTHIRNIFGNIAFMPVVFAKNMVASVGEGTTAAAFKLFGKNMQRTKSIGGALSFGGEYVRYGKKDADKIEKMLRGENKYGELQAIMQNRKIFKSKMLGWLNKAIDLNSRALEAEDWLFLKHHYARALTMYMKSNKLSPDTITEKQLEAARMYAVKEAQKATFRDESALASMLSEMEKKNKALYFGISSIMPFKKTPINILKRGIEYSPAGILSTIGKGIKGVYDGKFSVVDFIDGMGSFLSGSGLCVLGVYLASQGMLRGPGDDDDENKLAMLNGMQNYAIKIGNGTYTIDWMSPAAMALFVGCEMWNASDDGEISFSDIYGALAHITEPLFDMSMLDGVTNILEAASYAQSAPEAAAIALMSIVTNYFGQYVSTLSGQIARTVDNTRRKTYVDKNSKVPEWLQVFAAQQAKKIPGLTRYLEPYVNAKGEEEQNAEGNFFARAIQNFLSPGYYKSIKSTEVDDEISRLHKMFGEDAKDIIPKIVDKKITVKGETVYLSDEQYTTYQKTTGQTYYSKLKEIISSDYYKELSDKDKVRLLKKVREYSVEKGREETLSNYHSNSGWLMKAFETDGMYRHVLNDVKKGKFSEEDLVGDAREFYEEDKDRIFSEILDVYNPDNLGYELADKFYKDLYELSEKIALEENSDGQYVIEDSWIVNAKGLKPEERAQYIYGRAILTKYDDQEKANEALQNDSFISDNVRGYLLQKSFGGNDNPSRLYTNHLARYSNEISFDEYTRLWEKWEAAEKYKEGKKTIDKKDQILPEINKLKISDAAKSRIYDSFGWGNTENALKGVPWSYVPDSQSAEQLSNRIGQDISGKNSYTSKSSPYNKGNNGGAFGQCVWYVIARAQELLGKGSRIHGNGNEIYYNAPKKAQVEAKPDNLKGNMLVSYKQGSSTLGLKYGHVIYIEAVDGDTVYYTEGGSFKMAGILRTATRQEIMNGQTKDRKLGSNVIGFVDVTKY